MILLSPDITALRVGLGLPFILFFPGYTLILALFPRGSSISGIERFALSFGLSFAVVALIGLGLNYTPWGIRLMPVLYSQAGFILVMSIIAQWRQLRLSKDERFSIVLQLGFPQGSGVVDRLLSVVLVLAILGTVGTLIYTVAFPKVGERFTEFYILGYEGKAADYPSSITLSQGKVVSVTYGELPKKNEPYAWITVGIINREQEETTYEIALRINGVPIQINTGETTVERLGPITLANDEKWEQKIGFAPIGAGENQKVEFVLLVTGEPYFESPLHIWIDVTG